MKPPVSLHFLPREFEAKDKIARATVVLATKNIGWLALLEMPGRSRWIYRSYCAYVIPPHIARGKITRFHQWAIPNWWWHVVLGIRYNTKEIEWEISLFIYECQYPNAISAAMFSPFGIEKVSQKDAWHSGLMLKLNWFSEICGQMWKTNRNLSNNRPSRKGIHMQPRRTWLLQKNILALIKLARSAVSQLTVS